jgi:hypothetical protein
MTNKKGLNQHVPSRNSRSAVNWVNGMRRSDDLYREKVLALFQPDILIREQFMATYTRRFHLEPERTLMLSVLQDAVICFQNNVVATDKRKRRLFLEAQEWIMQEDTNYFYSFENICHLLGFSPSYLRRGLMSWKETLLGTRREGRLAS